MTTHGLLPFMGELMTCIMCDRQARSDPQIESQWRCLVIDGRPYYVCPSEFPPDSASRKAFKLAYLKVFIRIGQLQNKK